ncbi:hypothetical protein CC1G_05068 [Coprinopsis cinerea okayama7|uniref:Cep57 centrosome microtubule-binding domain-containing protein n=1 Tax=Coprinopsis cinerea (strain Okayama-7 / 130 / ATCC MYA-4618 / FGSC 9003) TaxID=240176 RepID=A8NSR3_COPC7|nr:hypothetical protein CC1G_05068 [Coprinopsis cinerea okayama7\|eukprot:XP_001836075.2 hypothetical protein CC1G_05068 [Coprinopsis cinerea okayama7\
MRRHGKGSAFDISIHHDELEQHRRQLEQKLKSGISAPLPVASDDEDSPFTNNNSSIEYPRHDSGAIPYPDFPSFAHRSGEFVEADSQMHGWSYRTGDDDEGINPYGQETMSTMHHHASALTITAGLGGRGARRDISLSGAEYDPDRPLNQIMAGVGKLSMFDEGSKSKNNINSTTFEPLVVDSTAELDRILQSGYAPQMSISRSVHPTPPLSNASSSSSDSESGGSPSRSRLTDHLRNVAFSPKRPRNVLARTSMSPAQPNHSQHSSGSPMPRRRTTAGTNNTTPAKDSMATPRPSRRLFSGASNKTPVAQPEVRLQPPTPSTASSKFTRMARGIAKDIEEEANRPPPQQQQRKPSSHESPRPKDVGNQSVRSNATRRGFSREHSKSRIVLPDVTGLTMAVESPARLGKEYYPYVSGAPRESEVRLLQTLNSVQSKLQQLNEENTISRRRVHELEMELDECKRDVARERTRLLEREEVMVQQHKDLLEAVGRVKGKAKARSEEDEEEVTKRYKEAVEEKKALEALINSLRTHLTRLTSELSSQQELLCELRDLRNADSQTLREKGNEIVRLNEEVERLAGEIEVLRGVVEEGLKERRAQREASIQHDQADVGMSRDLEEEEEQEEDNGESDRDDGAKPPEEEEEEEDLEGFDSSRERSRIADRTMRTDFATLGSSRFGASTSTPHRVQFVDQRELDEITAEVEERRSNNSGANMSRLTIEPSFAVDVESEKEDGEDAQSSFNGSYRSRSPSPMPVRRPSQQQQQRLGSRQQSGAARAPVIPSTPPSRIEPLPPVPAPSNPAPANTNANANPLSKSQSRRVSSSKRATQPAAAPPEVLETPFPQIRGERLERLFFSAPEHNPKTCNVCYRRRQHRDDPRRSPSYLPNQRRGGWARGGAQDGEHVDEDEEDEDDEGFAEGSDDAHGGRARAGVSTDPNAYRNAGRKAGLPPQTVVMRVVRDLEDDFTHYKSVYVELADQYKEMDAVSDVPRRNLLAKHLREVVDILEQKGDQIASLYELLSFKDKPSAESGVPSTRRS